MSPNFPNEASASARGEAALTHCEDTKASDIRALKRKYQNIVTLQTGNRYQASKEVGTTSLKNIWIATSTSGNENAVIRPLSTSFTATGKDVIVKTHGVVPADMKNANYKVDYMWVSIMGRDVKVEGPEFEVYTTTPATATITTEAKLNASGATILYNALFPAVSAENFDGSFSLKDANGKTIDLTNISDISYKKVNEDGSLGDAVTGVSIAKQQYNIDTEGHTKDGLKITITTPSADPAPASDVASGDKIAIIFTYSGKIAGTPIDSTDEVTLKVEIK